MCLVFCGHEWQIRRHLVLTPAVTIFSFWLQPRRPRGHSTLRHQVRASQQRGVRLLTEGGPSRPRAPPAR